MKEKWTGRILSILLVVAVAVSGLSSAMPMNYANATSESEYTELSFDDWGLTDSFVDNTGKKVANAIPITSWNKVAVSGYATFKGQGSILFDTMNHEDAGVRIFYYNGSIALGGKGTTMYSDVACTVGSTPVTSSATVLEGAEAYIRVEMDEVAANVLKVRLQVNQAQPIIGYYKLSNPNKKVVMHGFATGDRVTWRSITEEAPIPYTELTFDDWGLVDGYVDNTGKLSGTAPSGVTSWNKVAVSGHVAFTGGGSILFDTAGNTDGGVRILYYGGSVSIGGKGITMYSDATCVTGAGILTSSAIVAEGAEAYIRVELDVVATNVLKASLYVNDAEPVIGYYQLGSTNLKITMHGFATGDKVEWRSETEEIPEEPITYQEYTFDEWGLTDGYVENTGKLSGTAPSGVTSWDKAAVSGYVAFTGQGSILFDTAGNTDGGVRILYYGGSVSIGGKGITMYSDATCATGAGILTSSAIVAEGAEAYIRVELDVVATNVLKASLYVNDAEPVSGYYQLGSTNLKITMHGFATGDRIVWRSISDDTPDSPIVPNPPNPDTPEDPTVSDTPQKALSEYEMLTFSDLGIGDATFKNETKNCNGKLEDWDDKVFTGLVTFPTNGADERDGIITIGGTTGNRWTGLRIGVTAEGELYIRDASGPGRWEISPTTMNVANDVRGKEIKLSVTMTLTSANSAYVGVYVNDTFCGERLFANLMANLGATLMVYSAGATMKIASVTIGLSDTPQKHISEYRMLTFSDFGINNGEIVGRTQNCRATITNLNGKMFQGKVTFPTDGADPTDGILTIGGIAANRWMGLRVGVSSDGKMYILEGNNPAQRWNISSETMGVGSDARGQELEIALTFTYKDTKNVYVGLYVNGKFCGEKLFKNLVTDLGGTLMVYSKTAKIKVASSETPWTKFLKSDVNFAYFGFTDNWDSELTKIYKGGK